MQCFDLTGRDAIAPVLALVLALGLALPHDPALAAAGLTLAQAQ